MSDWICDWKQPILAGDVLCCPRCAGTNLHPQAVTVYPGPGDTTLTISATTQPIHILAPVNTTSPSQEREGIAITFDCETCGAGQDIQLTLAMGDGDIFVSWRYLPERPLWPGF